ncbi:MAG: MFS transporter, partial [Rhodobacteraceae bacterium]|nr:MFS transporter [Paracoccaceae bacterium]
MPNSEPTLAIFRNQTFRMLWIATLASNFGGLVQSVGAAWMMTSLSASESMVALVQTSITLPIMVFSLAAGVFADNF